MFSRLKKMLIVFAEPLVALIFAWIKQPARIWPLIIRMGFCLISIMPYFCWLWVSAWSASSASDWSIQIAYTNVLWLPCILGSFKMLVFTNEALYAFAPDIYRLSHWVPAWLICAPWEILLTIPIFMAWEKWDSLFHRVKPSLSLSNAIKPKLTLPAPKASWNPI